jgi:hypothetical protein
MSAPVTEAQLEALNKLLAERCRPNVGLAPSRGNLLSKLAVKAPIFETEAEIAKLRSALALLSPDSGRGNGAFYDSLSRPNPDYWLAVIWAIASLGWVSGKQIAKEWSQGCALRFTDEGFEAAWAGYKGSHPNPVGIGSLYKRVKELGWQPPLTDKPTLHLSNKYSLVTAKQLALFPPMEWAIKHVFPQQGIVGIYGPSQSGKSFLALDAGIAISLGRRWFEQKVTQTPVVYVALEGEGGYKNRVKAWEQQHQTSLPESFLFLLRQSFRLDDTNDVNALAEVSPQKSVIFIDTLNRAAPTADENSSEDMGRILEGAKTLQALTQGLVVIIHHTGKDPSRGARGHSSFFAALDAAIEVKRDTATNQRSWEVSKSKDSEDGAAYYFSLLPVTLGHDQDLEPVASCVVMWDKHITKTYKPPQGERQREALRVIKQLLMTSNNRGKAGSPPGTPCLLESDAIIKIAEDLKNGRLAHRKSATRDRLEKLQESGHICRGDDSGDYWIWLK